MTQLIEPVPNLDAIALPLPPPLPAPHTERVRIPRMNDGGFQAILDIKENRHTRGTSLSDVPRVCLVINVSYVSAKTSTQEVTLP